MSGVSTPGLVVSPKTEILRMRRMPVEGDIIVAVGARVKATEVVARADLPGPIHQIAAASMLGIPRAALKGTMLAKEGDRLEKDQVIARSTAFFGVFKAEVKAPIPCVLQSVSNITGHILLREMPKPVELLAYVDGKVVNVVPHQGIDVLAQASIVQGIFGLGGEVHGELMRVCSDRNQPLTEGDITPETRGKVLLGGAGITLGALEKMREVGVVAAVVGSVDGADVSTLVGGTVNLAATGDENLGFSLVVTEGFGNFSMAKRSYGILMELCGQVVSVSGVTQVRAGAVRPEVLGAPVETAIPDRKGAGLALGDRVRIVRGEFFGMIGTIDEIPSSPQIVGSGSSALVVRVNMDDGHKVTVPRANVEY